LRIWNSCGLVHQRADIAHRAHIDLAAGQEGHGAVQIDGEAALDAAEDHAGDAGLVVEGLSQLDPAFFAAGLVAAQHGFTEALLDALQVNLDRVAHLDVGGHARHGEFFQGNAAFGLEADIDHGKIVFDGKDDALDDGAFLRALGLEALLQHGREIFAGRGGDGAFGTVLGSGASHSGIPIRRSCQTASRLLDFPWPLQNRRDRRAVGLSKKVSGMPESRRASLAPVAVLERALQYLGNLGGNQGESCRERGVYTQIGGIQQVGVRGLFKGEIGRFLSASSRAPSSATTSCSARRMPMALSSAQRRRAARLAGHRHRAWRWRSGK
jgi:hypothetical protein